MEFGAGAQGLFFGRRMKAAVPGVPESPSIQETILVKKYLVPRINCG
jgi:hypothetical protein